MMNLSMGMVYSFRLERLTGREINFLLEQGMSLNGYWWLVVVVVLSSKDSQANDVLIVWICKMIVQLKLYDKLSQ